MAFFHFSCPSLRTYILTKIEDTTWIVKFYVVKNVCENDLLPIFTEDITDDTFMI